PIAGYLGTFVVGRVNNVGSALIGGALVGAIVGFAQALASSRRLPRLAWSIATTLGTSIGVAAGTVAIGYRTSLADLALAGLVTGVIVGLAQTLALPADTRFQWLWLPITAALWPLAWTVTTLAGIKVDEQFIVFGASGAIVYTVLVGLALILIVPGSRASGRPVLAGK
ncbi:MAG: hypothetical protein ACYC1E_16040, partial [Propionibacteriaceae bacterium]